MPEGMYDVLIYDDRAPTPPPWDDTKPLGGTEKGLMVLMRALQDRGLSVGIVGPPLGVPVHTRTEALIVNRTSAIPRWVHAKRTVRLIQDKERLEYRDDNRTIPRVFVSRWQRNQQVWDSDTDEVIYPLLDPNLYELAELALPKRMGQWIFPCSPNKGLLATLDAWSVNIDSSKPVGDTLVVEDTYTQRTPVRSWSADHFDRDCWTDFRNRVSPYHLARDIATSEGIFYVNTYEECFPVTVAIAKLMGCKAILECRGHEPCGVMEAAKVTLNTKEQVDQWLRMLRL